MSLVLLNFGLDELGNPRLRDSLGAASGARPARLAADRPDAGRAYGAGQMTIPASLNGSGPATDAAARPPVLEIRDFSVVYRSGESDVRAVDHVDLSLAPGETVGLAGESGSGKSTLALGACRLLRPPAVITGGSVVYRGTPHARRRAWKSSIRARAQLRKLRWREISIVFQSAMNALNPVLRIRDQLGDVLDAHLDLGREAKHERLDTLLDLVGIPRERLRSYPHELSGGMRQRVMIAMALAVDPEVVIMDEPTTALDVVVQREILAQIVELQKRLHFAVLFITHDLSLLLEIADRIAVMYAGRLVEVGSAEQIHHRPAHPYTRGLLARSRACTAPAGSSPGFPALRPTCARCLPAARSCRAAPTPTDALPRGRHGDAPGSRVRQAPRQRLSVRLAGDGDAELARAGALSPGGGPAREHPAPWRPMYCLPQPSAGRSCSRRTRCRRTSGSSRGPHGERAVRRARRLLRSLPQRRDRARRRERLGQVDRRADARRTGAADARGGSCSTAPRCARGPTAPSVRTRATCRWSSRTRSRR